jgi:hypothetical protein
MRAWHANWKQVTSGKLEWLDVRKDGKRQAQHERHHPSSHTSRMNQENSERCRTQACSARNRGAQEKAQPHLATATCRAKRSKKEGGGQDDVEGASAHIEHVRMKAEADRDEKR